MATVDQLKDALEEALARKGTLNKLRAELRAEVFKVVGGADTQPKPSPSQETFLLNELVREYLMFHGYRESLSVFLAETGQPSQRPFDRAFLAEQYDVLDGPNGSQLPLLYSLTQSKAAHRASPSGTRPAAAAPQDEA